MKKLIIAGLLILGAKQLLAQKMYSVDYENQADVSVFVVEYANQADLKVFKVDYSNQAEGNNGLWFFTDYANQADKKIFFVKYQNQSDLKIFFVKYRNQSGWQKNTKKHLLYWVFLKISSQNNNDLIIESVEKNDLRQSFSIGWSNPITSTLSLFDEKPRERIGILVDYQLFISKNNSDILLHQSLSHFTRSLYALKKARGCGSSTITWI